MKPWVSLATFIPALCVLHGGGEQRQRKTVDATRQAARAGGGVDAAGARECFHRLDDQGKRESEVEGDREAHLAPVRLSAGYAVAGD